MPPHGRRQAAPRARPSAREPSPDATDRRRGPVLMVQPLALTAILLVASFGAAVLLVAALVRIFPDHDGGQGRDDSGGPGPGRGGGPRRGGGPDRPPAGPSGGPREPAWWPEFEKAFAAHVEAAQAPSGNTERDRPRTAQARRAARPASLEPSATNVRVDPAAAYTARRTARTVPPGDDSGAALRDHPHSSSIVLPRSTAHVLLHQRRHLHPTRPAAVDRPDFGRPPPVRRAPRRDVPARPRHRVAAPLSRARSCRAAPRRPAPNVTSGPAGRPRPSTALTGFTSPASQDGRGAGLASRIASITG
jgi:hypothetical protein